MGESDSLFMEKGMKQKRSPGFCTNQNEKISIMTEKRLQFFLNKKLKNITRQVLEAQKTCIAEIRIREKQGDGNGSRLLMSGSRLVNRLSNQDIEIGMIDHRRENQ